MAKTSAGLPLEPLLDAIERVLKALDTEQRLSGAVAALRAKHRVYRRHCHSVRCVRVPQPRRPGAAKATSVRGTRHR
jgi:hypothetical protein